MKRIALATLLLLGGTALQAQTHPHHGFWIGFGFGGGRNLTAGNLTATQRTGGTGYLRLGGTLSQSVLLGFEGHSWVHGGYTRANGTATVMFYPSRQGLFVKGGLGVASLGKVSVTGQNATTEVTGFGITAGVGYELRIGGNLYLVPGVDVLNQFFKAYTDPSLGAVPGHNSIASLTLGLLWH